MDEQRALVELGLSPNESAIYFTLLKGGPGSAGQLAARSGIHRRTVYDALEYLGKKGKISEILHGLKNLSEADRKLVGPKANQIKDQIGEETNQRISFLEVEEFNQKLKFGGSFQIDKFNENIESVNQKDDEYIPGIFTEYSFYGIQNLTLTGGLRADWHNIY